MDTGGRVDSNATPTQSPSRAATGKKGSQDDLWHGREAASKAVRRYSTSEEAKVGSGAGQGTVMGVIFPCMANILGVLLFLRLPWIVGKAGVLQGFLLVLVCCSCTFVTTLSLSAVATNGKIQGGGSYFLISRSLGPALGAGVGLCFYMANSIGAAMYFMGTVEAWEIANPDMQILEAGDINNIRVTAFAILAVALVVVAGGVKFVTKLGTLFLLCVLAVILFMYVGCLVGPQGSQTSPYDYELSERPSGWMDNVSLTIPLEWSSPSGTLFSDNFGAAYDAEQLAFPQDTTEHNFISLMALWFPAVTGIMAGSNRSSDLKDPAGSIPKGTLFAQGVTSIIYLSFVLLYGAVAPRESLLHDKFFAASSAFPIKEFVTYGVMASTIGAGLTSLVSGTRLLSAIAGDRTLPILGVFAVQPGREPRLALVASGVLCGLAVAIGELNAVAPVLTMFFLMCYTCVNMSCAILEAVNDPNWRPTFRFHHWSISLAGAVLCIWMMFAMSPLFAGIAMIFCAVIFTYASHNSHEVKWGDGWQGMKFQLARNILAKMDLNMHTKNWRPQLLVITEADIAQRDTDEEVIHLAHPGLLNLASQLKGGRGITIFGGVCNAKDTFGDGGLFVSPMQRQRVLDGQHTIQQMLQKYRIEGFGRMVYVEDFAAGLLSLVQIAGLGAFQPNCVLTAWPKEADWSDTTEKGEETRSRLIRMVQVGVVFQKVMLLAKGQPFPGLSERVHGNMDIWWIVADGGILLLLPFLLSKHPVWSRCRTRLFAVADQTGDDPDQVKEQLEMYVRDFRLNIEVHVRMIPATYEWEECEICQVSADRAPGEKALLETGQAIPDDGVSRYRSNGSKEGQQQSGLMTPQISAMSTGGFGRQLSPTPGSGLSRWRTGSEGPPRLSRRQSPRHSGKEGAQGTHSAQGASPFSGAISPEVQAVLNTENEEPRRGTSQDSLKSADQWLARWRSQGDAGWLHGFPMSPPTSIGRQVSAPPDVSQVAFLEGAMRQVSTASTMAGTAAGAQDRTLAEPTALPSVESLGHMSSVMKQSSFMQSVAQLSSTQPCSLEELALARLLNKLMVQESTDAELVVTNLPDMPPSESAYGYFELVEEMTKGLKRTFLVRGTALEVITAFT